MRKKVIVAVFAFLTVLLVPNLATADIVQLGDYNVTLNQTNPGLMLDWSRNLQTPTAQFELAVGQSVTFNLFDLWATEKSIKADDKVPKLISVAFTFLLPQGAAGTVGGTTVGQSFLFGVLQFGEVKWQPLDVAYGNGGKLRITLSDAIFSPGLFGLGRCGADISAKFTLLKASVPEPSSVMLLIPGLVAFGAFRKRLAR